jgi:signal transduction histidine kinase
VDLLLWRNDTPFRDGGELPWWVIPALTVVIYPMLVLRWRHPRAVFAVHWAYSLGGLLMPAFAPVAGLLVALYALARRDSLRVAAVGLVVCLVPITVNSYNVAAGAATENPGSSVALSFGGPMVVWGALALTVWGLGRSACAAERRAEQEKREQAAAAVRAERLHLARELHDIVSHSVSAMILQAAGARTLVSGDDEQVRAALEAIETTGVEAMGELHRLLGLLRAAGSDEDRHSTAPPASLQDLDSLVASVRATGVDVEVVVEGHPTELDRSVGLAAYRIVQEALTNTIKHAGRGAAARIHLRWKADGLTLTIRDRAGLGAHEKAELSSGHGLAGLAERVVLVGGTLEAGPVADGFLVQAHLPTRPPVPQTSSPFLSGKETP